MNEIILTEYEKDIVDILKENGALCIYDIIKKSNQREYMEDKQRYSSFYSTANQLRRKGLIHREFGSGSRNGTLWSVV